MSGTGPAGAEDPPDGPQRGGRRDGDAFHAPAGVQHGSGNLQVNLHEHRTRVLTACAVALVCVAVVIAVRMGGDPGRPAEGAAPRTPDAVAPGPGRTDPSPLTGRLVNDGSGMCLRVPGAGDGLVPVQDTCSGAPDRTWTLGGQEDGAPRTLRDGLSGRCLTLTDPGNFAPARQFACAAGRDGQHWELLWGEGGRAGHSMLRGSGNAKCLVVQGAQPSRPAVQASCGDAYDDQWWHLAR
ncbi:RICIN domain-containing protein [Streptomyces sp. NPDC048507]|uniref:RICIN domain-containing protein n=1 Tax=Streptomyces sp. NPDC048507 TaxID=3365560 RepID=UPI003722A851